MKLRIATLALLGLAACRGPAPAQDAVAELRSGAIRIDEVERVLTAAGREGRKAAPSSPSAATAVAEEVARYKKAAESLALERTLLADVKDLDVSIEGLGKEHARIRRSVVVELWERENQAAAPIRVTEAEVKQYFDAHPEEFHRKPQRFVWHLFRRHEDPGKPEATLAFLAGLKQRVQKGEAFRLLAREYSQSETRLLDGRLGAIGRGRLHKPLEDIVFSLPEDSVSDPVPVKGGAVLFYVSEAVEEKRFPLADVRVLIGQRLRDQKARERMGEAVGDWKAPTGAVVLDQETLARQLDGPDPEEVVLRVGATEWTAKEFMDELEKIPEGRVQSLPGWSRQEGVPELYERLRQEALLYDRLQAEAFAESPLRQRAIQERVRALGRQELCRRRIEERIWKKVDEDPAALRRFHEDNRFLYQTPLRLKLKTLTAPLGADPPQRMAELEGVRGALARGEISLDAAAKRLGGVIEDGDWLGPAAMAALEPKVRSYVLEMNGTGYSVPFQLNNRLNIVFVEKRDEPRVLPYEEVRDRVRQDYRDRRQQELYQAVADEVLKGAGFHFHEDTVRRVLGATSPQA